MANTKKAQDNILQLMMQFNDFPIDYDPDFKKELGIQGDRAKSIFQWSGQFPPGLAEKLLKKYANKDSVVLDPFCGSGTTLFEAAKLGMECHGSDINPAAVKLAETVMFCNVGKNKRKACLDRAKGIIEDAFPGKHGNIEGKDTAILKGLLDNAADDDLVHSIIMNALMRFSISKNRNGINGLYEAFETHRNLVMSLPYCSKKCIVAREDARDMSMKDSSVDLVLTSPPYIGSFDYYRNYKHAMWIAGYNITLAKDREIGGTFGITQVQYGIQKYAEDMCMSLIEMKRVLKEKGRMIIVIGRESEAGRTKIRTSAMIYALAVGACGLNLLLRQERETKNRRGNRTMEDILHFSISKKVPEASLEFLKGISHGIAESAMEKIRPGRDSNPGLNRDRVTC